MSKINKKDVVKKLQRKAEDLWKKYCLKRDGRECQVKKYFPWIKISHTEVMQVDHCFSRNNKEIFIDVANGTVLCSTCNSAKGPWRNKAVDLAVNDIVIKREGRDTFNRLREIAERRGANINWGNVLWLEEQIKILEELNAQ